ncbi:MAG: hypothetical protein AAF288_03435 [Planctomycetota bacterium]
MNPNFMFSPWFWVFLVMAMAASMPRARRAAVRRAAGPSLTEAEPKKRGWVWIGDVVAGLCAAGAAIATQNPLAGIAVVVATLASFAAMVTMAPESKR